MKAVLIALSLLLVSFEAHAISRYNSTSMSCGEIKATVRAEGAVILRWRGNSGIQRYGRFVAHGGFCKSGSGRKLPTCRRPTASPARCANASTTIPTTSSSSASAGEIRLATG